MPHTRLPTSVPFIFEISADRQFKLCVPAYESALRHTVMCASVSRSNILLDPTRKVSNAKIKLLGRAKVEMFHMSFVRRDISSKLQNVSNRVRLGRRRFIHAPLVTTGQLQCAADQFCAPIRTVARPCGRFGQLLRPVAAVVIVCCARSRVGVLHPHPAIGGLFNRASRAQCAPHRSATRAGIGTLPNHFDVDLYNQCQTCRTHDHLLRCSVCKWAKYWCVVRLQCERGRHFIDFLGTQLPRTSGRGLGASTC